MKHRTMASLKSINAGDFQEFGEAGLKIRILNQLTSKLEHLASAFAEEVKGLNDSHDPNVESGFDFYEEVRRYEVHLIKCALKYTGGHQLRAGRLINLNHTTLNSKMKQYGIPAKGYAAPPEADESDSNQPELSLVKQDG